MVRRIAILVLIGWSSVAGATNISTGDLSGYTTAANPLISSIGATPAPTIRFEIGGSSFLTTSGQLNVTIGVDALVPTVTSGTSPNQMFRDESMNAAYFGYYLTAGVKSASQPTANISLKIRKGSGETTGRSYYLLGNGTSIPSSQSDLTAVPASFTTFAVAGSNSSHCGPNFATNGLTGTAINCGGGSTVSNLDITQFVKVLDSDTNTSAIVSQVEFIAVNE